MPESALKTTYRTVLLFQTICFGFNLAAIWYPTWFKSHVVVGKIDVVTVYGLGERCSSVDGFCVPFPTESDCTQNGELFCAVWRTASFTMIATVVLEAVAMFTSLNALWGNTFTFENGWKAVAGLLGTAVVLECFATISMDVLLETARLFATGHWRIGTSWALATTSWVLSVSLIIALVIVGLMSPSQYDEFFDDDLESTDDEEEHDDFYYFNRRARYGAT